MALARSEESSQRFYSLSAQIRQQRKHYYANLEWTQKGELDVTRWRNWFTECLQRSIASAEDALESVLVKARFWERFVKEALNE